MPFLKTTVFLLGFLCYNFAQSQEINLQWQPRTDLNSQLPPSVKIYDSYGTLPDGKPLRAMYAEIDLRDENLKFRSIGSDAHRETTVDTYHHNNAILAINGGYFAANASSSLIIEDGEIISPGTNKLSRGAFGLVNGKPEVTWTTRAPKGDDVNKLNTLDSKNTSEKWLPSQAVGGGPVLMKNGRIQLDGEKEGFAGSHMIRHPRSAVGHKNDHTLLMLVVEGRQEASAGVTLSELAQIMKQLNAKEAVNLDGGGSSAMVAANEVVNVPVNITGGDRNNLRNNAGALIISEKVPSKFQQPIYFDTEDTTYSEVGIWKDSNLFNYYGMSASRVSVSNPLNRAYYHFESIKPRKYQIGAWFNVDTAENSSEVHYILHRSATTDTIKVDQTDLDHLGKWVILGEFQLSSTDSLEIQSTSGNQFISDAIRLLPSKDIPEVPARGDLRVAVISDLNSGLGAIDYEWQVDSIVQRIPRIWQPDLVISGGDLVAGMGVSDPDHLQKMWDAFTVHIVAPLNNQGIPFAFTLGNHDGPRSYKVEHDFAKAYWNQSDNKPTLEFVDDSHFPNYYSFVKNGMFFVSWEASSSEITEENLEWMKEQFQLPAAKNARHRFVMGHMPLYSVAQERDSKGDVLQHPEKLQALLERYNVTTYISGHQHAFYPGKRGKLELLNTGAAGSGARSWLTQDLPPTNTITIMDIYNDDRNIQYTTYAIKEKKAADMAIFDIEQLPSAMFGVNGYVLRRDRKPFNATNGGLYSIDDLNPNIPKGHFSAKITGEKLHIAGSFSFATAEKQRDIKLGLYSGRNGETGTLISKLRVNKVKNGKIDFDGTIPASENLKDFLSIGSVYVSVTGPTQKLRGQIYPSDNTAPHTPVISSHQEKNTYGIRNLNVLGKVSWTRAHDTDGDFVTYTYQMSSDSEFKNLIFQQHTGRSTSLKFEEKEWYQLLNDLKIGETATFHHRVLASDGSLWANSKSVPLHLLKSDEKLTDLAEVAPPQYTFKGKIASAGAGYGALWDYDHKVWLADYKQGLIIKNNNGEDASFSPLTSVTIDGKDYQLNPVNGIGKDLDGNILAGINRHLIKIDAKTGKGMAVWEAPQGNRALTSPRAAEDGNVFVMSLFGEDPNFVLQQDGSGFKLIKTLQLKERHLARTFDMSADGRTLYFPDPGSAITQVYHSQDGEIYREEKLIRSLNAGSSALQVQGEALYFGVRSSGISPSSFHYRNNKTKQMWTLDLPEVQGAEPRGIGVSADGKNLIFCSWDKDGGYYLYTLKDENHPDQ